MAWFTKQSALYAEIFDAFDIKKLIDLNAGSGGRLKSAFILKEQTSTPLQVDALVFDTEHQLFVTTILDKFLMHQVSEGKIPFNTELNAIIKEHFKPTFAQLDAEDADDSSISDD